MSPIAPMLGGSRQKSYVYIQIGASQKSYVHLQIGTNKNKRQEDLRLNYRGVAIRTQAISWYIVIFSPG